MMVEYEVSEILLLVGNRSERVRDEILKHLNEIDFKANYADL